MAAVLLVFLAISGACANHFRGGTINWQPTGIENQVEFSFKLGWYYGRGPGCSTTDIGNLTTGGSGQWWKCTSGCSGSLNVNDINYICTGASIDDQWEQGERNFVYNFTGIGPYTVSFSGCCWIYPDYGSSGNWSVETKIFLAKRSDLNQPNTSPVTAGKPLYIEPYGRQVILTIPMIDSDGDTVRCRWATGNECVSVCNTLPYATLNSETCTITFHSNHTLNGMYAVALTIEDFPNSNIIIGGQLYTPDDHMSSVPLQFLINTVYVNTSVNTPPVFVNSTPPVGSVLAVKTLQTVEIHFYAYSNQTISRIDLTSPAGMTYTSLQNDSCPDVYYIVTSWTPSEKQTGSHILCAAAVDNNGLTSNYHCIALRVSEVSPCDSNPCTNNKTCIKDGLNYTCECPAGFTGVMCETDINDCIGNPCDNGGTCIDVINGYYCSCLNGYTGLSCESDIDECVSRPCQNGGLCTDILNGFICTCPTGTSGSTCDINFNECNSSPCENGATCYDAINGYSCGCSTGYTGVHCETDIDECVSRPCQNGGLCTDILNGFNCTCPTGTSGTTCEINFNECNSSPCENGATCYDAINGYSCGCSTGYTGVHCETDIDECVSRPCQNGGLCTDILNGFNCTCPTGTSGTTCEINIDECVSRPCQNGGLCTDILNGFNCTCPTGTSGTTCEIKINECASAPCQSGGTCTDLINGFSCLCPADKWGIVCNIDRCSSDPCPAMYQCNLGNGTYSCEASAAMYALIVTSAVSSLGVASFVAFKLWRPSVKVDHSWLSNYTDVRKPDNQPKHVFTMQKDQKQHLFV
ncbi:protein jagged-2-like [Ostrea edulis]|uniref:protein jagged-2-like n=1 Tax=Ostrea edulis TaxID=37623 RepID=UPI0024AEC043|nr:protein jagged-2-like [Ostrea edulis]